jgi:hypothetical protein
MNLRTSIRIALWTAVMAAVAAGPPSSDSRTIWNARVDRDLALLSATEPVNRGNVRSDDLAVAAYLNRPTAARKAFAVAQIKTWVSHDRSVDRTREGLRWTDVAAAKHLVDVDDLDGGQEMLKAADAPTTLPSNAFRNESAIAYNRAYVLIRCGKADGMAPLPPDLFVGKRLAQEFEEQGRPEMAKTMRKVLVQGGQASLAIKLQSLQLAKAGRGIEAINLAKSIDSITERLPCILSVARMTAGADSAKCDQLAIDQFFVEVAEAPSRAAQAWNVLSVCADRGDRAGVEKMAGWLEAHLHMAINSYALPEAVLADAWIEVGDTKQWKTCVDRASTCLANSPPKMIEGEDRMLVLPYLSVAAAYARGGDKQLTAKTIASIPTGWDRSSQASEVGLGWVEQAFISAGQSDDAIALAKTGSLSNLVITRRKVVHALALHGEFDRARKLVIEISGDDGLPSRGFIVYQQIKRRNLDGLPEWIDALPSPYDRALLDVTVELAITGKTDSRNEAWAFDADHVDQTWYPEEGSLPMWLPNANGT